MVGWLVNFSGPCATRRHLNSGGEEGAEEMDMVIPLFSNGTPYLPACGLFHAEYPKRGED